MSQSDTTFARLVGALKYISLGRDRHLAPPASSSYRTTQVPGGPFVSLPGPAKLTLGKSQEPRQAVLALGEQVTLVGANSSGAGVLQNSLIAQQIARNGAYVLVDFKLDQDRKDLFAHLHQRAGTLDNFRVLNVDDPSQSHTYNPLARGSAKSVAERVVLALVDSLYREQPMTPAEVSTAVSVLTGLVQALRDRDGTAQFKTLHEALESKESFQALVQHSAIQPATRVELAVQFAGCLTADAQHYDLEKIRKPIVRVLRLLPSFATGKLGQVLNVSQPEIDMLEGLDSLHGMFVMLPVMGKDAVAIALGQLVVADLTDALEEKQARVSNPEQPPALVVTTETALLGQGNLLRTFAAAKSAGVNIVASVAATRNMMHLCETDREALLCNTATKVFLRTNENPEVRRAFGELLAQAGASGALPSLMESLDKASPGEGFISRGVTTTHLALWPNITVPRDLDSYHVPQRQTPSTSNVLATRIDA